MRLFKLFCSVVLVFGVIFCGGASAFAKDKTTYSVEVPDGFTEADKQEQTATWKNSDGSVIINLAISENTSKVKVNPNDAGDSYLALLEDKMTATLTENTELNGEVTSIESGFMELGEHDAIKVSMVAEYTFENGTMTVYQNCYVFETQNYVHAFVVTSDEDTSQFSDDFIKGVKINDKAVERRGEDGFFSSLGGSVAIGALKGALIGAAVGVVIALAKKFQNRKANKEKVELQENDEINQEDIV